MAWIQFLKDSCERFPHKVALVDQVKGERLTYRDLWQEGQNWANFLKSKGVKKGDRVAFLHTNCRQHLTLFFASSILGAVFVPLNFRLACEELKEILRRVEPKLFLTFGKDPLVMGFPHCDIEKVELKKSEEIPFEDTNEKDPLLMLFTSGTTGTPKGVLFHGQMLTSNQKQTCRNWKIVEEDICLVETPFFHTGGYNVLCLPLLWKGGTVVLAPKFELDNVFKTIQQEKVSVYFAVPTMFQMISEDERFECTDFSSIRFFVSGGAYCSKELITRYQEKNLMFKQGFGLTEVGPNCFLLKEDEAVRKMGSIGRPMPHSQVALIADGKEVKAAGEIGELVIKGPHVCAGYYAEDQRFADSLWQDHFKTGDLAKYDSEGFYYIVGRKKDMYISGGENVYPAEVEKKMISHPDIQDAVVVPVPSENWGETGLAFIRSNRFIEIEELREFLNPILSRYKHPQFVSCIDEFPLLASGKVDRVRLKKQASEWSKGSRV